MAMRLAVVEFSEVARVGIREIIAHNPSFRIAGEYTSISSLFANLEKSQVDIVLLSDRSNMKTLIQTVNHINAYYPNHKVIMLAETLYVEKIEELCNLGVLGILYQNDKLTDLLPIAIQTVSNGDLYLSPTAARLLISPNTASNANPLNLRQMQVLRLMARYFTPQEIAVQMSTSAAAIYALQHRIRTLLGVRTTGQIVIEAVRRGWIEEE